LCKRSRIDELLILSLPLNDDVDKYLRFSKSSKPINHEEEILSLTLVGSHHGHVEIAGRQDVKHAVILALAPVFASLFRGKLIDRRF
jgi:hypothetical protein